ncbi:MAG: alpha-galactosidase [Chitinophagaceae bacterium]
MKIITIFLLLLGNTDRVLAQDSLPVYNNATEKNTAADWLVTPVKQKAAVYKSNNGKEIVLYNGLVKRAFRLSPNLACIDYKNMSNGQQLLRAVKAEARLTINGKDYNVGGLYGQQENAYLMPAWIDRFTDSSNDFHFVKYTIDAIQPALKWKPASKNFHPVPASTGVVLRFVYQSSQPLLKGLLVTIHYQLYDGIPLIIKWLTVENKGNQTCKLNRAVNEILAFTEEESAVVGSPEQMKKQHGIYVETNYAFNNAMRYDISDQTTHWKADSAYTSQVNYNYQTPCLLEVYPEKAPGIELQAGETFTSVRTHELLMDSYDRERRGLAIRKMYRAVAPWTLESPIFMHLVSKNDDEVKNAVDQCRATGYEALILSFGSHCNMEDTATANLKKWKELAAYAHGKNIMIGSYSLFSSRRISDEDDVIDPATGKPGGAFFGNAPCYGSNWGLAYLEKIKYFISQTGFNLFENDGPYPGDVCASTTHPGHKGLNDSQWRQMELQKSLYHWCNEHGVYVNAPDWYFLDGTNKIALGYREVNFSLSREQQKILNRQNIFDGTWEKTPSMSWGFVPLTRYQGGGPEAVLEPLSEHLDDYRQLMMQYYGAGVQACYRGPRLYDTDATKQTVIDVISWYKKYFDILNADIIHLRRADGRDWDGWMHVSPGLGNKALVMLFNPLKEPITRTISLPLYYAGLGKQVAVIQDGKSTDYLLDRAYNAQVSVTINAGSYIWFTVVGK